MRATLSVLFAWILAAIAIGSAGAPVSAVVRPSWSDFDHDGYSDLAIGMPSADVQGIDRAGAVIVLYGSPTGLTSADSKSWTAHNVLTSGPDEQEAAAFGTGLAAGDFDKDGFGDLAIGAPGQDVNGRSNVGKVYVLFGTATGLTNSRTQVWSPSGVDTAFANSGAAMVALDWFDAVGANDVGDGYADLAVGGRGFDGDRGRVDIIAGQRFAQLPNGVSTTFLGAASERWFGASLAAGDFNDTVDGPPLGQDDLAIGAPLTDLPGASRAGMVIVKQRLSSGLVATSRITQDAGTVPDTAEAEDRFGASVAAGDLNGDGLAELVVGAPFETLEFPSADDVYQAGIIHVLAAATNGTGIIAGGFRYRQGLGGVPGTPQSGDSFGTSLVLGDFDGDGDRDLAIGNPDDQEAPGRSGAVTVIYNNGSALIGATAEVWNQASAGIPGAPNLGDSFGAALTAGRYDAGSAADLVVGIPSKDVVPGGGGAAVISAGMVDVIYGASSGLSSTGAQGWTVESPGVPRNARYTDNFGDALR